MNQKPAKRSLITAVALLGLLAATIGLAYVDLGPLNTIAALSISVAKATLIVLFFMEIGERGPLIWIAWAMGLFWLGIMFALSMSDFMTRGWK